MLNKACEASYYRYLKVFILKIIYDLACTLNAEAFIVHMHIWLRYEYRKTYCEYNLTKAKSSVGIVDSFWLL